MVLQQERAAALLAALSSLIRSSRAVAHRNARELGASGTPLGVLKRLSDGDARPSDLAATLQVAPSVVSRVVASLETDGLLTRTTDPDDGRASLLTLSTLGRQRLDALQRAYADQVAEVLSDWSDDDAATAVAVISRLDHALAGSSAPETHRRLVSTLLPGTDVTSPTDQTSPIEPTSPTDQTREKASV